jgi:hypothetical protein
METIVKLSNYIILAAKNASKSYDRTTKEQLEHWMRIGQIVEENPTLTYESIKKTLRG